MLFTSAAIAAVLATVANAQTVSSVQSSATVTYASSTQFMPVAATQAFNIALVDNGTKLAWCQAQRNSCPEICGGRYSSQNCDETTLQYSCICSNGTVPDCSAFMSTIPYFECQATYGQCVAANPNNLEAQTQCTNNEVCGTRNATAEYLAAAAAASSSGSSRTSSATGSATGASSSGASASASHNAAATTPSNVSPGLFAALLMGACGLLL